MTKRQKRHVIGVSQLSEKISRTMTTSADNKSEITPIIEAIFKECKESLIRGDTIEIDNFAKFTMIEGDAFPLVDKHGAIKDRPRKIRAKWLFL